MIAKKFRAMLLPVIWAVDLFFLFNTIGMGVNYGSQGYGGDAIGFGVPFTFALLVVPFTIASVIGVYVVSWLIKIVTKKSSLQDPAPLSKWYFWGMLLAGILIGYGSGYSGTHVLETLMAARGGF